MVRKVSVMVEKFNMSGIEAKNKFEIGVHISPVPPPPPPQFGLYLNTFMAAC